MEIAADRNRQYGMCVAGRFRLSDVPFAATWKSACGWVAAWHQKSALAPVAGDTVASRRCFRQESALVRV
jgi:hypothetical protein